MSADSVRMNSVLVYPWGQRGSWEMEIRMRKDIICLH